MNAENQIPLEAEIVAIYATLEEAKTIRADLACKVQVIKTSISENEWKIPQGPWLLNGRWMS